MNPTSMTPLDLRDIHAAAAPPLWPPAPGWWLLAVLLIAVLAIATVWLLRRYHRYRQKRQIIGELDILSNRITTINNSEFLAQLSILLRRIALRRYSRERVASLTGSDWLRFLDATGGGGEFEHGVGHILETGPYRPYLQDVPAEELLAVARRWVLRNIEVAT